MAHLLDRKLIIWGATENVDSCESFDAFQKGTYLKEESPTVPECFKVLSPSTKGQQPFAFQWFCRKLHSQHFDSEDISSDHDELELIYPYNLSLCIRVSKDDEAAVANYLRSIHLIE